MDLKSILQLLEAARETDFDKVVVEDGEFKLRLERNAKDQIVMASAMPQVAPMMMQAAPMVAPAGAPAADAVGAPIAAAEPAVEGPAHGVAGAKDILSPLVGVFHELPGGKTVKIGDKLKKGDTVCMVEAMKLMNEITMPEDGEIVWVAAGEGDTVEYDQLLYNYK